jgi:predicted DsbA family dithiol-disulfide isomerase
LFSGRGIDIRAMNKRMVELMRAEGLPYGERTHTYNSRLAQELGKWADACGVEAIHNILYRAYFAENRNISNVEELMTLAQSAGLPASEARDVLLKRRFREAVDADWMKAREYGVTGVPTFVSGNFGVVGAQPYDALKKLVCNAGGLKIDGPASLSNRHESNTTRAAE